MEESVHDIGMFQWNLSRKQPPLICDLAGNNTSSGQIHEPHPVSTVETVLHGKMFVVYRGMTHCILPGDVIFLEAGENHRQYSESGPFQKLFVAVSGAAAQDIVRILFKGHYIFHPDAETVVSIRDNMLKMIHFLRQNKPEGEISALLFRILCDLNMSLASDTWNEMDEILKFMESHISTKLSACSPSEALHIPNSRITSLFRLHFQMTPAAYFLRMRMQKALDLLKNSTLSVKEIASAVGYGSGLTFSREFRKYCGVNPTDFRKFNR